MEAGRHHTHPCCHGDPRGQAQFDVLSDRTALEPMGWLNPGTPLRLKKAFPVQVHVSEGNALLPSGVKARAVRQRRLPADGSKGVIEEAAYQRHRSGQHP